MGAPPEILAQVRARSNEADFYLWEENLPVFEFFCGLRNLWQYVGGMGPPVPLGLDRTAVIAEIRLRWLGRCRRIKMLDRIIQMESAALEVMRAKLESKR